LKALKATTEVAERRNLARILQQQNNQTDINFPAGVPACE
jgi:hypothetical protein